MRLISIDRLERCCGFFDPDLTDDGFGCAHHGCEEPPQCSPTNCPVACVIYDVADAGLDPEAYSDGEWMILNPWITSEHLSALAIDDGKANVGFFKFTQKPDGIHCSGTSNWMFGFKPWGRDLPVATVESWSAAAEWANALISKSAEE